MERLTTIRRDVAVAFGAITDPRARSRRLAEFAAEEIIKARATNKAAGAGDRPPKVAVDGKIGAALASVKPDGVVVAQFDLFSDVLRWIHAELMANSPVLTGDYRASHRLFVDGVDTPIGDAPLKDGVDYTFVSTLPYSRKIEGDPNSGLKPQSKQAPDGVYEAVAAVAKKRFGNVAKVYFIFTAVGSRDPGDKGNRYPAILVRAN